MRILLDNIFEHLALQVSHLNRQNNVSLQQAQFNSWVIPLRRWQDCYLQLAIIDVSKPKDFNFGEIIVQVFLFSVKALSGSHVQKDIMHFTIETGFQTKHSFHCRFTNVPSLTLFPHSCSLFPCYRSF